MKQRTITYTNKPRSASRKEHKWMLIVFLAIIVLVLFNNLTLKAEGTKSIAPSTSDEAALFVGAGNTGTTGGDYGQFAWKGSTSKLSFNIQNTCEKAYFGFSIPKKDRSFRLQNQITGGDDFERKLIFRVIDPRGVPINNLSCFGNTTIDGEVWQTLRPEDINLTTREMTDIGPKQLNAGGYDAFELDLSACGLNLTGDYSVEFYTTANNYNPDTPSAGFYIEYFDVTVASCASEAMTGRLWSNNWGLAVKKDGDGPFDRAFNGSFYICSKEGFITKIDFNTKSNNRAETGKNNDQQSGFRAGAFNVSFNRTGPKSTGNIITDRKSVFSANETNPELAVFLNLPDPSFCPPQSIGDFKSKNEFISGCPNDYCINLAFSKPGQIEILIEDGSGNRKFDHPSEVRLVTEITEVNRVSNPEDSNYPYEVCLPWNGKDGYGTNANFSNIFISGFYFQGIYHFPVYDAEFNDDGFTVETVRPALGVQELFYDDLDIPSANQTGENKDGTNGCDAPCHRWTGEYENFTDRAQIFGNFNTINTWWFGNSTFKDFSFQASPKPALTCPPNYVGCVGDDISPNVIGNAAVNSQNPACTVIEYTDRLLSENSVCSGDLFIERTWSVYLQGLESDKTECFQLIRLEDKIAPELTGIPADQTVACGSVPTPATTITATDNCNVLSELTIALKEETLTGTCAGSYKIRRIWTATDKCGNSSSGEQVISVVDDVAPILVGIPTDITVKCDDLPTAPTNVSATDNCEASADIQISMEESVIAGNCRGNYTIERRWIAVDLCGNQSVAAQIITVIDDIAPVLSDVPVDETVNCGNIPQAATSVKASDNCESDNTIEITLTEETIAGACAGNYTIERTWMATDQCGNNSSATQTIMVVDTESPIFQNIPDNVTVSCDAVPPIAIGAATNIRATDNCETEENIQISFTETEQLGTCSGNYSIERTWTATDQCGNQETATQILTIIDTTSPILVGVPKDTIVNCHAVPTASDKVKATDNCTAEEDISIDLKEEKIAGDCVGNFTIKRTWTAVDDCGNQSVLTQTLTVVDTVAPILIGLPTDVTVECDAVPIPANVTASDNCEATEDIIIVFKELRLNGICQGNYLLKRAWTATDQCGNFSFGEQVITVEDNTAPIFTSCPKNLVVMAVNDCESAVLDLNLPAVTDNCEGEVSVVSSADLNQPFPMGTTTVIFTATDECGNTSTCEFLVKVENAPLVLCPADTLVQADCETDPQTAIITWVPPNGNQCCSACPINTDINNFIFLGERGGHRYYLSREAQNWEVARSQSDELDGYLVSINDPAENSFLSQFLVANSVYIGLSDNGSIGEYYWQNDAELIYENWEETEIRDSLTTTQFALLTPAGKWMLSDGSKASQFILEIPCVDVIQLSGPLNGSAFPIGTTTISYVIDYDNCPNRDTCSFEARVEECEQLVNLGYCKSSGVDTTCFWVEEAIISGMEIESGRNGGYGDFTDIPINVYTGFPQKISLTPNFAPGHTFNVFWKIWIDYNQNEIFDTDELIFAASEYRPITVNFTVPNTAMFGQTRMRIAMNFADNDDPCASLAFGEVEDYLINIGELEENIISNQTTSSRSNDANATYIVAAGNFPTPIAGLTPMEVVAARKVNLSIFPNPTKDLLMIDIENYNFTENRRLSNQSEVIVYNQMGQLVYQATFENEIEELTSIDIAHLKSGIYFLQVKLGATKVLKRKFIKME